MADDRDDEKGDRSKVTPLHIVRTPKTEQQQQKKTTLPSPEAARELFMASPHLEWTTWAKSMKWDRIRQGQDAYPEFPLWAKEKRDIIAKAQAEAIGEALFKHQSNWHTDVLDTLKTYPKTADAVHGLLQKRLNDIIQKVNDDEKEKHRLASLGQLQDYQSKFDGVSTKELAQLAVALKTTTETKHKALMIDGWTIKTAESYTDPRQFEAPNQEDQAWRIEEFGGKKRDAQELKEMMYDYYDKPDESRVIDVDGTDPNDEAQ